MNLLDQIEYDLSLLSYIDSTICFIDELITQHEALEDTGFKAMDAISRTEEKVLKRMEANLFKLTDQIEELYHAA